MLLLGAGAYLLLSGFVWSNVWRHPTSTTTCGCGDTSLFTWFLEWPAYAIAHGLNPFYSTAMHVPSGVNLLANTSVVAIGVLLAPVTWLFGPVATPQRGPDPGPGAVRPVHVRAPPPMGHLGTGRLRRRPVLRVLAVHPGHPQRRPPDAGDGRGPPAGRGLPGRAAVPAATASGADGNRPRPAGGAAVLHRHRGPGDHGD